MLAVIHWIRFTYYLGQAPVQHHDLTEITENDIVAFEIPMNHSARVGICNGVADSRKGIEKRNQFDGVCLSRPAMRVILSRGFRERTSFHKAHRVKRLIRRLLPIVVDRNNTRVFELSCDASL